MIKSRAEPVTLGQDPDGHAVLTGSAAIPRMNWYVFFEQPLSKALQPVYGLLYRTGWLLALAIMLAVLAGMLLARQLVTPIRALQVGARQLEASDFGHRINVKTADEIEELADHFNRMADQLQGSYSRLEQKVADRTRDLAQSNSELKALEEIGRAVASSLDINAVLATIVTQAVKFSRADAGAIYSYDASRDIFELAEAHALDQSFQDKVRATRITLDESALGLSAKQRGPVSIPDLSKAPNFSLKESVLSAGFNSVLIVPLFAQDDILGALVLQRRETGDFPASTVDLMQTFANQSVLAMKNAQLFREVDQKGRELAIASEHKSQFVANMSHELRTPLNAVLGYSELLADGLYGSIPQKGLDVLERIQANGKHLLSLINDVLDISKIEAGQLTLALDDYSVEAMVQSVVAATGSLAQAKGIEVKTSVPNDLPMGRGDERRLTQVLLNLVSNAIKFTDTGEVEVRVQAVNGEFNIMVCDTGPGIAPKDQATIFEQFQQIDNTSTRKKGGTGLGLSISRQLVGMHGGRIDLDSTARCRFHLQHRRSSTRATAEAAGVKKRILIIEDTEDNRRILRDLLTHAGYDLIEADDGAKGVAMAAEHRPDLILMDIQLPTIDGYEATRQIKANPDLRHIPIVAVTSYALSGDEAKSLAAGCDGYIAKPFSPRKILAMMRDLLR